VKRFRFPLDRVRLWREEQATLEEMKLQRLYGEMADLAGEKTRTRDLGAASEREILDQDFIDAGELQALDAFRGHVRGRIGEIERREREVTDEIERQRARLIEASQRAELLKRLKQKQFEQWRALANREEEIVAGELYLARWRR
jgi:flagellar export protein FliJ